MDMKKAEKVIEAGVTVEQLMSQVGGAFGGHSIGISAFEKPYLFRSTAENEMDDTRPFEAGTALILGADTEKEGVGGVKTADHAFVTKTGWKYTVRFPEVHTSTHPWRASSNPCDLNRKGIPYLGGAFSLLVD